MRNFHQRGIDTRGRISGKIKTICPQCNDTRGHKGNKSLSVDLDKGLCYCHHCGYTLHIPDDAEERRRQERIDRYRKSVLLPSHFRRPVFNASKTGRSEALERYWTEERCLRQELLDELRITEQREWMPQSEKEENCLCFNYFEGDTLVNTKFRSGQKHFKMVKDAELIPYNIRGLTCAFKKQGFAYPPGRHHRRRVRRLRPDDRHRTARHHLRARRRAK